MNWSFKIIFINKFLIRKIVKIFFCPIRIEVILTVGFGTRIQFFFWGGGQVCIRLISTLYATLLAPLYRDIYYAKYCGPRLGRVLENELKMKVWRKKFKN